MLVLIDANLTSYTNDNNPSVITDNISKVFSELEITIEKLFRWYDENQMKASYEKCNCEKFEIQLFFNFYFKRKLLSLLIHYSNTGRGDMSTGLIVNESHVRFLDNKSFHFKCSST